MILTGWLLSQSSTYKLHNTVSLYKTVPCFINFLNIYIIIFRLETIKKYEEESKINMEMLKAHSEKLKEALMAANKAKDLEKAKKLVAEAQVCRIFMS